jgi:predicted MFS family arabinose efflux permease
VRALAVATLLAPVEPALGHLLAVAACLGVCEGTFRPSVHASVPDLVPYPRIVAANALVASTASLAIVGGGALGGLAPVALGLRPALVLAAASFAASAAALAGLALRRPTPAPGRAPLRDLGIGLRYCRSSPLVRGVLVVTGLVVLAASLPVPSPLGLEALGPGRQPLGHLASWCFGVLLGASAAPAAARRWPRERLLPAALVAMSMAALAASQATGPSSRLGLWLLAGGASALVTVSFRSLLQERVAAGVRGRGLAASEAVLTAAWLAGSAASGRLAAAIGLRPSFAISAALLAAAASMSTALITPHRARHAALRSVARTVPSPG